MVDPPPVIEREPVWTDPPRSRKKGVNVVLIVGIILGLYVAQYVFIYLSTRSSSSSYYAELDEIERKIGEIHGALLLYAADHDDHFPVVLDEPEDWAVLNSFFKSDDNGRYPYEPREGEFAKFNQDYLGVDVGYIDPSDREKLITFETPIVDLGYFIGFTNGETMIATKP